MSNTRRPPSASARLEFFVRDSDGLPVPSLSYTDVSAASYQTSDYAARDAAVPVTLSSDAANTAAISAGQFITIDSAKGHYAIDCPSGSTVSTRSFTQVIVTMTDGTQTVDSVLHEIDKSSADVYSVVAQTYVDIQTTVFDDLNGLLGYASSAAASLTTIISAIGAWTGTGVNTILGAFKSLLSKTASTPSDIGGTFDPAEDSIEKISDRLQGVLNDDETAVTAVLDSAGLTTEQQAQIDRIESQTAKLSGTPVTVTGNVKPGGQVIVKQGDDHTVALGNPVIVPVDDVGGALYTLMNAVGVGNLSLVAIRGVDPASRIAGTVAALSYASNVLTVTLEFTAAETEKGVVGPAYNYDLIKTATPTRTYFSGRLTVTRDAR